MGKGGAFSLLYAAKAGVIVFTKCLAMALADDNIRVHCIAPGYFVQNDPQNDEEWQRLRERGQYVTVGWTGYLAELGPLAVFLASEASSHMTGDVVYMDGGGLVVGIAPIQLAPTVSL